MLDYRHEGEKVGVQAMAGGRCPLSTFAPQRSLPVRASSRCPEALPALRVARPDAVPGRGEGDPELAGGRHARRDDL